jgi:hypothetical protein
MGMQHRYTETTTGPRTALLQTESPFEPLGKLIAFSRGDHCGTLEMARCFPTRSRFGDTEVLQRPFCYKHFVRLRRVYGLARGELESMGKNQRGFYGKQHKIPSVRIMVSREWGRGGGEV